MIHKAQSDRDDPVRVTFSLTSNILAERVTLVGDFNDWDTMATPMRQDRPGADWQVSLDLASGCCYRFHYLVDDKQWLNDWHADDFLENPYGSSDSAVDLTVEDPGFLVKGLATQGWHR
jgi:1,4-alpha-glucan branching enzyme